MTAIATTDQTSHRPTRLSVEAIAGVQRLTRALMPEGEGRYSISKASAPSEAVRAGLARRQNSISAWLRPAGDEGHGPIDLMLGTLRLRQDADEDVEARRAAYHIAMADLPLFVIEAACTAALRAQTGDRTGRYAPSPGELHKAAERAMEPILREKADITKILLAKVIERPTPEQRAAAIANVRGMVKDVLEDIAMKNAPKVAQPDEIKAAAEARLAEMEAEVVRQNHKEEA